MCRTVIYITLEVTLTQSIDKLHTKSPRSATSKVSAASTLSGHIQNNYRRHQVFGSMGRIEIKQSCNLLKRYCCVFTCLASRATHLEMVYSLTTESFLMGLRRFLSVRGYGTRTIYSDNATNFVAANAELKRGIQQLNNRKITSDLGLGGIEWKHAPPFANHQGGNYKAIIRLVRKVLESMMDDQKLRSLTDEAFGTLLKEIECILNNRPLTRVGTDTLRSCKP